MFPKQGVVRRHPSVRATLSVLVARFTVPQLIALYLLVIVSAAMLLGAPLWWLSGEAFTDSLLTMIGAIAALGLPEGWADLNRPLSLSSCSVRYLAS